MIQGYRACLEELLNRSVLLDIEATAEVIAAAKEVVICGNGGSATTASHFATDLSRVGVRARSLCDNIALLTALANDFDYRDVFARQIAIGRGDVLVAISVSGQSANLLRAMDRAKRRGAVAVAIAGCGGGRLAKLADRSVRVSTRDFGEAESVHSCLCHIIPRLIMDKAKDSDG